MGVAHVRETARGRTGRGYALVRASFAVLTVLVASVAVAAADPASPVVEATIAGHVRDSRTQEPIEGAWVALAELDRSVLTDAVGRYELPSVPPGPHHLSVRHVGYAQRTLHAIVPREGTLEIDISLDPRPHRIRTVDVRAPVKVRGLDAADSIASLDREASIAAIRNNPLLTEPDVVQGMEGGYVVLRPEEPSGAHVRGGGTDQTAYLIDGIPVFSPYHAAGMSSAWNPDALAALRLGAPRGPAMEPHALSGALDAETRAPGARIRGQGSVSTTQARVTLDGPIGSGGAGYLLSLRSGFAGLLGHKDESSHLRGETGDVLAKVEGSVLGGRGLVVGYDTNNEIDAAAVVAGDDPGTAPPPRNTFQWRSRSMGVEWRRSIGTTLLRVQGFGAFSDGGSHWAALAGLVRMATQREDVGVLADVEHRSGASTLGAGVRVERSRTSYHADFDSTTVPDLKLEGRTPVMTGSVRYARRFKSRSDIELGAAVTGTEHDVYVDPRAVLHWSATDHWAFSARYARSRQFVQSLRNPESVVGTIFPVDLPIGVGAPGVPAARSDLVVVGGDYRPTAGLRLSLQAYGRESDGLLLVAPVEPEPFSTRAFTVGSGTSRGVSVEAAMGGARYGLAASYGYQDTRFEHEDSSYVPEHGVRHVLEGGVTAFPTSSLSVRLGAVASWGRRTTVATGEFEWESCNLLDQGCEFSGSPHYVGDPLGGKALPTYFRMDLGARQHWDLDVGGRNLSMAVFGAVTNLLGWGNRLTYTRDPSTGRVDPVDMRPRSPLVFGIDWWF